MPFYDILNVQIMVRTIGLSQALDKVIGRVLGEKKIVIRIKFPNGEGPQHLHVGNRKLPLLLRMFSTWMTQLTRSTHSLKK